MSDVEPRTIADIMRDLLEAVKSHEWVEQYESGRGCGGDCHTRCPACGEEEGDYMVEETYRTHASGCRIQALILETEAFLRAEEVLNVSGT